ncbi:MAG: DNA-3-methyladenine glycosylase 2 family protein [Gammaproteobacteria bacterium]|nr:DNA-3-methyladenine glycosylase 2 family protein [Gammaproteobacteria bacterium]
MSARRNASAALAYDPEVAIGRLSEIDDKLARLIEQVGAFDMPMREHMSPFEMLLRSIVYQQISGKAAASIHARVAALFPRRKPGPRKLRAISDEALRGAGLSRSKLLAVRDLADKTIDRTVPSLRELHAMDDESIIERLVEVRGIGRWTVEMLLISPLGRPDVLPVTDLGIRKGFQISHGGRALPDPKKLLRYGERWRPYRTVASWYLWRANDLP